jgi:hypothetical protein
LAGRSTASVVAGRGMARHAPAAAVCSRREPAPDRVRRHSFASLILLAAGLALFLAAAQGTARAQQGPSRLSAVLCADASQDAPEPYVPRDEEPPPGILPKPWKTWTTDQDIEPLRRIGVEIFFGYVRLGRGKFCRYFEYSELFSDANHYGLRASFGLTPALSLAVAMGQVGGTTTKTVTTDSSWSSMTPGIAVEIYGPYWTTFTVGIKLALPILSLEKRPFAVEGAECPSGLTACLAANVGTCVYGTGPNTAVFVTQTSGDFRRRDLHEVTNPVHWDASLGIGYRWTWFGCELTCGYKSCGRPTMSSEWISILKADAAGDEPDEIRALGVELTLSLHF